MTGHRRVRAVLQVVDGPARAAGRSCRAGAPDGHPCPGSGWPIRRLTSMTGSLTLPTRTLPLRSSMSAPGRLGVDEPDAVVRRGGLGLGGVHDLQEPQPGEQGRETGRPPPPAGWSVGPAARAASGLLIAERPACRRRRRTGRSRPPARRPVSREPPGRRASPPAGPAASPTPPRPRATRISQDRPASSSWLWPSTSPSADPQQRRRRRCRRGRPPAMITRPRAAPPVRRAPTAAPIRQ